MVLSRRHPANGHVAPAADRAAGWVAPERAHVIVERWWGGPGARLRGLIGPPGWGRSGVLRAESGADTVRDVSRLPPRLVS
jgi:hypothetical protein